MHLSRRSFVTGAIAAVTLPLAVRAQTDTQGLLNQVPGLQTAYGRRYAPADSLDWGDFPVEPNEETPEYLIIMALTFENETVLTGVLNSMLNESVAGMIMGQQDSELTSLSLPDLPEGNQLFFSTDGEESSTYASLLVVPAGDTAYLISLNGESEAVQTTANTIATHLVDTEPSDAPVVVIGEGTAEGGPFDVFPGVDDLEMLNGLVPLYDYDLLVSDHPIVPENATPGASPEASPVS